ncbi:hypothetical protein GCWU000324_02016 [Kingella oralis ATCC 51147]|uniref:Uncharacterized protein n=1 Tax=Kingella oralis ATCC 51147 TaxID=629741 RepID=C4GIZ3_9NEIS|nr:hypothetical protein GCWU000324_02016 [Kingella oralis ATCC 51147]
MVVFRGLMAACKWIGVLLPCALFVLAALKFVTLVLASLKPVALVFRLPLAGIGQPEIRQKGRV